MRTLDEIQRDGKQAGDEVARLEAELKHIQAVEQATRDNAAAERQIKGLRDQLAALPPPPAKADEAAARAAEIQAANLRKEFELATAAKECEGQRLANAARMEKINQELEALAPQIDAAAAFREEMLRDSTGAFEAAANRFLSRCSQEQFAFSKSGPLTFGLYDLASGFRPYQSLSGGESILCLIAFQVGLFATRSEDCPLKTVLTTDLDRISPVNAQFGLLKALGELVADGTIGQAIVEGAVWLRIDAEPEHYRQYVTAAREHVERMLGYRLIDLTKHSENNSLALVEPDAEGE